MASELAIRQRLFVRLLGLLINYVYWPEGGRKDVWEFSLGEGFDSERDGGHMHRSLHYVKLAQDLNLFVNGEYITDGDHPAYKEIGTFWESLHPLARWGGRFGDANHFSVEWEGRK